MRHHASLGLLKLFWHSSNFPTQYKATNGWKPVLNLIDCLFFHRSSLELKCEHFVCDSSCLDMTNYTIMVPYSNSECHTGRMVSTGISGGIKKYVKGTGKNIVLHKW